MSTPHTAPANTWAIILGASSGFGAATALELARSGYHICGVHLDLKATLPQAKAIAAQIEGLGRQAVFFNMNAADPLKRAAALDKLQATMAASTPPGKVGVLLHSLAFGTLKPLVATNPEDAVDKAQLDMTLDVMANSLVYWVQDLFVRKMFAPDSRVFAMTSAGAHRVVPNYGPVSAAKAALESHIRQLALELAAYGVCVNGIQAGVTDTPALRKIPGHETFIKVGLQRHPQGRLTTTQDVAGAIAALCDSRTAWITGTVITVDGGEDVVG